MKKVISLFSRNYLYFIRTTVKFVLIILDTKGQFSNIIATYVFTLYNTFFYLEMKGKSINTNIREKIIFYRKNGLSLRKISEKKDEDLFY